MQSSDNTRRSRIRIAVRGYAKPVAISILGGALITQAVAIAISLFASNPFLIATGANREGFLDDANRVRAEAQKYHLIEVPVVVRALVVNHSAGMRTWSAWMTSLDFGRDVASVEDSGMSGWSTAFDWFSVGWPFRSEYGFAEYKLSGRATKPIPSGLLSVPAPCKRVCNPKGIGYIPCLPLWPGQFANTLFYAAILLIPIIARHEFIRVKRRRRARCANCGYPIAGQPRCSECGTPVQ